MLFSIRYKMNRMSVVILKSIRKAKIKIQFWIKFRQLVGDYDNLVKLTDLYVYLNRRIEVLIKECEDINVQLTTGRYLLMGFIDSYRQLIERMRELKNDRDERRMSSLWYYLYNRIYDVDSYEKTTLMTYILDVNNTFNNFTDGFEDNIDVEPIRRFVDDFLSLDSIAEGSVCDNEKDKLCEKFKSLNFGQTSWVDTSIIRYLYLWSQYFQTVKPNSKYSYILFNCEQRLRTRMGIDYNKVFSDMIDEHMLYKDKHIQMFFDDFISL